MDKDHSAYSIGVDIGGTKTAVVLIDEKDDVIDSVSFETVHGDSQSHLAHISRIIASICSNRGLEISSLRSIGIGVPGTVDNASGIVLFAPNIEWKNVDMKCISANEQVPIYLAQDTHAAAVGEYLVGAGKGSRNILCITVGTGIGAGIIIEGRLYRGTVNAAGELGHVLCKPDGKLCKCGKRGCLETCVSGTSLNAEARRNHYQDAMELFEAAGRSDGKAKAIVYEAIEYLGIALVNAANLLSPDAIIISGGLCEQKIFIEGVKKYVYDHVYPLTAGNLRVEKAGLGSLAPAIGAALLYKVLY